MRRALPRWDMTRGRQRVAPALPRATLFGRPRKGSRAGCYSLVTKRKNLLSPVVAIASLLGRPATGSVTSSSARWLLFHARYTREVGLRIVPQARHPLSSGLESRVVRLCQACWAAREARALGRNGYTLVATPKFERHGQSNAAEGRLEPARAGSIALSAMHFSESSRAGSLVFRAQQRTASPLAGAAAAWFCGRPGGRLIGSTEASPNAYVHCSDCGRRHPALCLC